MAGTVAVSSAVGLPLASAGTAHRAPPPATYVLRGTVVQYIAPAGSTVGSLSVRVKRGGTGGERLTGELVTVAIQAGDEPTPSQLLGLSQGAACQLTLNARSATAVMKGRGQLRSVVAPSPVSAPAPDNTPPAPATVPADKTGGADGSVGQQQGKSQDTSQPDGNHSDSGSSGHAGDGGDHGNGGDHGSGGGHGDPAPGSSAPSPGKRK